MQNCPNSLLNSFVPPNWEDIANFRLQMLEQEYQECISANIKGDPNDFKGLQYVLDHTDDMMRPLDSVP